MIHENGWKKDLEIKQLKEQNEILNERLKACETALDETSQRIADADCPAIKTKHYLNKLKNQYKTDSTACK